MPPPPERSGGGGFAGVEVPRALPYLALALGVLAVGVSSWRPVPGGVWHDDGVYLMVGRSLAAGDGLVYGGVPGAPAAVKFPPLYPGLVAGLWWLLPGIGPVTLAATLLNLVLLATAAGLLAWTLRRHGGLPLPAALLAAGLGFASADLWRTALVPLSEATFVLLLCVSLLLWARAVPPVGSGQGEGRTPPGTGGGLLALAAVVALAVWTRSAAVALVAGLVVGSLVRRAWVPAAAAALAGGGAFVVWSRWGTARAQAIVPELADVLGPYGAWLLEQSVGAPGAFLAGLPGHAGAVAERVGALLVPGASGPVLAVAALPLAALGAVGAVRLHRTLPPLPWTLAAYLGVLLLWPYADRRLVAPAHPWVVALVVAGGFHLAGRLGSDGASWGRKALVGAMIVWSGAYAIVSASRVARGWAAAPYRLRAERLATAVETLRSTTPGGTVVGAPEFWAALHLHGGWPVAPSARFRIRREGGGAPVWGTPAEQIALWHRLGVRRLLLEQGGQIHGDALNLLEETCPGGVRILARMPPQMLVSLEADPACLARAAVSGSP